MTNIPSLLSGAPVTPTKQCFLNYFFILPHICERRDTYRYRPPPCALHLAEQVQHILDIRLAMGSIDLEAD